MISRQFTLMRLFSAIGLLCLSLASIALPSEQIEFAVFIGPVAACAAIGVLIGGPRGALIGAGGGFAISLVLYFVLSLLTLMGM
jgi:hypothetical protein